MGTYEIDRSLHKEKQGDGASIIRLQCARTHIDRMQFSIKNYSGYYDQVQEDFNERFQFLRETWVKRRDTDTKPDRRIRHYRYESSRIHFIQYLHPLARWITVSVSDTDIAIQSVLRDILSPLWKRTDSGSDSLFVYQVEWALDLYPANPDDLMDLHETVTHSMVLKHGRVHSCRLYESTVYFGRRGDVRKRSWGIRCYPSEPIHPGHFLRIELQANGGFLMKHEIELWSLPLSPNRFNPLDLVEFRRGLDVSGVATLMDLIKKEGESKYGKKGAARWRMQAGYFVQQVGRGQYSANTRLQDMLFAHQVDWFKKCKRAFGLTQHVEDVLPKIDVGDTFIGELRKAIDSGRGWC